MPFSNFVLKVQSLAKSDTVNRVVKTIVEVVAAQTALYTTVVPNPPNTQTSAAIAGGAGVLALLWNALIKAVVNTRNKRLVALRNAIETAAAAIVDEQQAAQKQAPSATDQNPPLVG